MLFVVAMAAAMSLALTPMAGALAWKLNAVSRPDGRRRLHSRPTPLWGGIAVYFALLLSLTAFSAVTPDTLRSFSLLTVLGLSAGMLCLLGCCDDLLEIRAHWKLVGQILVTMPVVLAGWYVERLEVFGYYIELGWLGIPWTIGWLVLGINAMNLLDGMDGLASVVGMLMSATIALIAASQGLWDVTVLGLALAGAIAGFLVYNLPTARIYLGDCGSMLIGLTLFLLVLSISHGAPATVNLPVVVALAFVPLTDTGLAIVRRVLWRRSIMCADRGHIHHRLLDRGLNAWRVLGLLGGFCLITQVVACWAAVQGQGLWTWLVLSAVMAVLVDRQLVGHVEWALAKRSFPLAFAPVARLVGQASQAAWWRSDRPPLSPAMQDLSTGAETPHLRLYVPEAQGGHAQESVESVPDQGRKAA